MIRTKEDVKSTRKPAPFNGIGEITVRDLLEGPAEMYEKGRVFGHTTVYPGSKIGYHVHKGDSETYYILSGTAKLSDNGKETILHAGDVAFTGDGEGHSLECVGDEPVEMIALILYH
ncbi:MAG: cupin domain-containing protein [Eubacteriales bacterium]|nr:cupin domain-containing protein [Eubacteriales bacterium]